MPEGSPQVVIEIYAGPDGQPQIVVRPGEGASTTIAPLAASTAPTAPKKRARRKAAQDTHEAPDASDAAETVARNLLNLPRRLRPTWLLPRREKAREDNQDGTAALRYPVKKDSNLLRPALKYSITLLACLAQQAMAQDPQEPERKHPLLEKYPYILDFKIDSGLPLEEVSREWLDEFAEERYRRLIDPTYLRDLELAVRVGDRLFQSTIQAIDVQDFDKARVLLDSVAWKLNREYKVYRMPLWVDKSNYEALSKAQKAGLLSPTLQPVDWDSVAFEGDGEDFYLYREEEELWNHFGRAYSIGDTLFFLTTQRDFEEERALSTRKGTLERLIDIAALWFFDAPRGLSIRSGLPTARFVKSIEVEGSRLTLRIRPSDCHRVDYEAETISFKHPKGTIRNIRTFMMSFFVPKRRDAPRPFSAKMWSAFDKINEVVVALYFPGSQTGTETVIAQFGLKREFYDKKKWSRLKTSDGTFQDYLKTHGTYWLHADMPDMGTPVHLLR